MESVILNIAVDLVSVLNSQASGTRVTSGHQMVILLKTMDIGSCWLTEECMILMANSKI